MFVGKDEVNFKTVFVDRDSILTLIDENSKMLDSKGEKILENKFATYIIDDDSKFEILNERVDYKFENSYRIITEIKLKSGFVRQIFVEQYYDRRLNNYYLRTTIFEYKIAN